MSFSLFSRNSSLEMTAPERRARSWDRWATFSIVAFLLVPVPFARFEAWPTGTVISEHIVMPWSGFRICYAAYPHGDPVEEEYSFTWKGEILPRQPSRTILIGVDSVAPPILKWQNRPEVTLKGAFFQGDLIKLRTFWQPLLLWPFQMVLRAGAAV